MFHHARVAEYQSIITALAEEMVNGWADGEVRDVHRDFTELTLAIIARTVFDVALDDEVITVIRTAIAAASAGDEPAGDAARPALEAGAGRDQFDVVRADCRPPLPVRRGVTC